MSFAQALQRRQHDYNLAVATRGLRPAPSIESCLNLIILVGWLLASCRLSPTAYQRWRWLAFLGVLVTSAWSIQNCRSIGIVGSIGVGLNAAICTMFAINFILLHDPRTFQRLTLRSNHRNTVKSHQESKGRAGTTNESTTYSLEWEAMPESITYRLLWIVDLLTSLRRVHWSGFTSKPLSSVSCTRLSRPDRTASLPQNITRFFLDYVLLDLIKSIMITDPYFLGDDRRTTPPHLAAYIKSPAVLYTYRIIIAVLGIYAIIDLLFISAVLLQVHLLGSDVLGINASPSMFPQFWGDISAVFERGLRGFWGETWHQLFRPHFVSIADVVASILVPGKPADRTRPDHTVKRERVAQLRGQAFNAIRVTTVFLLSGALHACGSYTLPGPTRPWAIFLFFAIQPAGMAVQHMFQYCVDVVPLPARTEPHFHKVANLTFTLTWLWMSAGLIFDDFSTGGVWLLEPIPVSLIRGLGYSKEDRRFWCWSEV